MTKTKTRSWDVVDHLKTDEDIAHYLEAVFEDGDPALVAAALGDVARVKGMSQVARDAGLGRESLYKALSARGQPGVRDRFEGHPRSRPEIESRRLNQYRERLAGYPARFKSGGTASSASILSASSSGITCWPSLPRRRIETVRSAASFLPTTSITGTFASECSRTL